MKYAVLIQARCGSTRLPNKVMKNLCGKSVLQRMIERVQRSKYIDEIIILTSFEKNNLPIVSLCAELGIRVFCGSENDVLDRYYQAAKLINADYIIRLTADCPCFDASLLDLAIETLDKDVDYRGMLSESFADGLDLEIIKYSALKQAWEEAYLASEREHVTQYIIHHPEIFKHQDFKSGIEGFGNRRWTVDEPEDFELVKKIFEHFLLMGKENFNYKEILSYLDENPNLEKINCMYIRNEGLVKSLENDYIVKR